MIENGPHDLSMSIIDVVLHVVTSEQVVWPVRKGFVSTSCGGIFGSGVDFFSSAIFSVRGRGSPASSRC